MQMEVFIMQYCPYCGAPVNPNADVCLQCGHMLKKQGSSPVDDGSVIWLLIGLFVPVAGLVLWLTWKDSAPKNAKKAGLGALISTIGSIAITILIYVVYLLLILVPIIL